MVLASVVATGLAVAIVVLLLGIFGWKVRRSGWRRAMDETVNDPYSGWSWEDPNGLRPGPPLSGGQVARPVSEDDK